MIPASRGDLHFECEVSELRVAVAALYALIVLACRKSEADKECIPSPIVEFTAPRVAEGVGVSGSRDDSEDAMAVEDS